MRFDLFSSGRLYAAMEKAGYPDMPAKRTLQDWIKNDSAPNAARLFVAELLGSTKEPPEPAWLKGLVAEVRMNRAVIQAMFAAGDAALVQRILDRFAALEPLPTSSSGEALDPIDAAT